MTSGKEITRNLSPTQVTGLLRKISRKIAFQLIESASLLIGDYFEFSLANEKVAHRLLICGWILRLNAFLFLLII